MNDPSNGVPPALLPHVHLLSNFKFPIQSQMGIDTIVDYLLQAPNIVRNTSSMTWAFVDAPANGTVLLVWQPGQLGSQFASDGYVWGDAESAFSMTAKDCHVEMLAHRVGYQFPIEPVATHCRRRYRLTGSKNPNMSIDPSLWLVHYTQSEPTHQMPVNRIPMAPQTQQMLNTRRYLQSAGQLVRKEFMLHDRNNWPTINLPGGPMPAPYGHQGGMYQPNGFPQGGRGGPQVPYYPPQQQAPPQHMQHGPGPSPKRQRQDAPSHMVGASNAMTASAVAGHEMSLEEEEDTSRGDSLDHLTPREISMMRYRQHHEWMEEILSSPYAISQIIPVDLGLGLKGELEPFTQGFFASPTSDAKDGTLARVGKMEPAKADEFRKRAAQKLAKMQSDIEKMKRKQTRRMTKLKTGSAVNEGERRLRNAVSDPTSTGIEVWRLEGLDEIEADPEGSDVGVSDPKPKEGVDDIVREIEQATKKRVADTPSLVCVQRGGLEDKAASDISGEVDATEALRNQAALDNANVQDSSTTMLDDFVLGSRSHSQQNHEQNQATPGVPQMPSSHTTPGVNNDGQAYQPPAAAAPPALMQPANVPESTGQSLPQPSGMDVDTEMTNDEDNIPPQTGNDGTNEGGNDWVVVDKDDVTDPYAYEGMPDSNDLPRDRPQEQTSQPSSGTPGAFGTTPGSGIQGLTPTNVAVNTPGSGIQGLTPSNTVGDTPGSGIQGLTPTNVAVNTPGSGIQGLTPTNVAVNTPGSGTQGLTPAATATGNTPHSGIQGLTPTDAAANTPGSGIQGLTPSSANAAPTAPAAATPASAGQDNTAAAAATTIGTDNIDANQMTGFTETLDTARDTLTGYAQGGDGNNGISLEDHPDLAMDDSAFGDAFHGTETESANPEENAGNAP